MKTIPVTPTLLRGINQCGFECCIQLNAERVPLLWYTSIISTHSDWHIPLLVQCVILFYPSSKCILDLVQANVIGEKMGIQCWYIMMLCADAIAATSCLFTACVTTNAGKKHSPCPFHAAGDRDPVRAG